MPQIEHTYHIAATREAVWDALVNPKSIEAWGGGPAKMSATVAPFSLWDGEIHGKNLEVIPSSKLVQEWYGWEEELGASRVSFQLTTEGKETVVTLLQTDVPESEFDDVDAGWGNYYMEPLIEWVESR